MQESNVTTGLRWAKESATLYKSNPRQWMLLSMLYISMFMMVPALPGLGFMALVCVIAWPVFMAFSVMLFREEDLAKNSSVFDVVKWIKPSIKPLLLLGVGCLLYVMLTSYVLNNDMAQLLAIAQQKTPMTEGQTAYFLDKLFPLLIKSVLLLVPLFVVTWYSPALIVLNGYPLVKAIKSSIAGTLQYLLAMLVTWLVISAGVILTMLALGITLGLLSALLPVLAKLMVPLLVFLVFLIANALMFAFQYVSYRDAFKAAPLVNPV